MEAVLERCERWEVVSYACMSCQLTAAHIVCLSLTASQVESTLLLDNKVLIADGFALQV